MLMKNILVTGGAGFIGSNLIKSLIEKGFNVTSLDNYSTGSKSNEIQDVKYYNLDIEKISKISESIDLCFHLAAQSNKPDVVKLLLREKPNSVSAATKVHLNVEFIIMINGLMGPSFLNRPAVKVSCP